MNRNKPKAAAPARGTPSFARSTTTRKSLGLLLAIVVLISTTLTASLFATARGNNDDAQRIEKICVANGGHYERTGAGGACIDTSEWLLD